jgi:hypothetical protein
LDHYIQRSRNNDVTICPCCGFKFEGSLSIGCAGCGARSVGEPLPKPEHELPAYGRSLLLAAVGSLMVVAFLIETIIALFKHTPISLGLWSWIAAAETAAWRLKWVAIPVTIVVLWAARKVYRSMLSNPQLFCGLRYARAGLVASAIVPLLIAVLIGVTIPERLRQREYSKQAGAYVLGYTFERAFLEYRQKYEKLPNDLNDLRQLPDPDGSIAAALNSLPRTAYETAYRPKSADVASVPKQKPRTLRGAVIRNASLNTASEGPLAEGFSFTNYELSLPGPDKVLGTEDDLVVRDGVITSASEKRPLQPVTAAKPTKQ